MAVSNERILEQRKQLKEIGAGSSDKSIYKARAKNDKLTLEAALERFAWLSDGKRVVDLRHPNYDLAFNDFEETYSASYAEVPIEGNGRYKRVPITKLWKDSDDRISAVKRTFKPGAERIVKDPNDIPAVNTWIAQDRSRKPTEGDRKKADLFFKHIEWLFKDRTEDFLDWLSHIEQDPGTLPHTAWLHVADKHGLGRNWIGGVLGLLFKGQAALNYDLSSTLKSGFNGDLAGKVLAVVDEIKEGGAGGRSAANTLRQMVNAQNRKINPKMGRQSIEFNACRWLIFSNHITAVPLDPEDRRFEVVHITEQPKPPEYYVELYALINDKKNDVAGFIAAVAERLANRDISGFNPGRKAKETAAKARVASSSSNDVIDLLRFVAKYWPAPVIRSSTLRAIVVASEGEGLQEHEFRDAINESGAIQLGRAVKFKGTPVKVRVLRDFDAWHDAKGVDVAKQLAIAEKALESYVSRAGACLTPCAELGMLHEFADDEEELLG